MLISFSDLQMVNISLRVLARPDQALLPSMYRQLGQDFDERVLPSICNEVSQIIMANASGVPMIRWYRLAVCWKLPIPIID